MSKKLTLERVRELIHYDEFTGIFTWIGSKRNHKNGTSAGCVTKAGHRVLWLDGSLYTAQSVAWLLVTGEWPKGFVCHEDKDLDHNAFSNLYILGSKKPVRDHELTHAELLDAVGYEPKTGTLYWVKPSQGSGVTVGDILGESSTGKYMVAMVRGRRYMVHRLVWFFHNGKWPEAQLDHINRVKFDNRIENLRECSNAENKQNQDLRVDSATGFTGVHSGPAPDTFLAGIGINGKRVHLGSFRSPETAFEAYRKAKAELHTFNPTSPTPREQACAT